MSKTAFRSSVANTFSQFKPNRLDAIALHLHSTCIAMHNLHEINQ